MKILVQKSVLMLLAITILSLLSCKEKQPEPEPDLATKVSGRFTYSELIVEGQTFPASETSIKGTITITKKDTESVDVKLDIRQKANNFEFMVYPIEDVTVSPGEDGAIDFFYGGHPVAQFKGNKLYINATDEGDKSFTLVGVR